MQRQPAGLYMVDADVIKHQRQPCMLSMSITHLSVHAGLSTVAATKYFSKAIFLKCLPHVYAAVPQHLRKLWQPPMHHLGPGKADGIPCDATGRAWDISMTARFFSYFLLVYVGVYESLHWCMYFHW